MKPIKRLLWIIPLLMAFSHPFFLSVMEVEYSSKTKEIGISCKLYPDDLEETLRLYHGKKYDLNKDSKAALNEVLDQYFRKHVTIMVNGKPREYAWMGFELDKEVVWVYFNIPKVSGVRSLGVVSNLMYEYKGEQTNIIHLNLDGNKESFRLRSPETKAELSVR